MVCSRLCSVRMWDGDRVRAEAELSLLYTFQNNKEDDLDNNVTQQRASATIHPRSRGRPGDEAGGRHDRLPFPGQRDAVVSTSSC